MTSARLRIEISMSREIIKRDGETKRRGDGEKKSWSPRLPFSTSPRQFILPPSSFILSLRRHGERACAFSGGAFVGDLRLPLAGHVNPGLAAVDAGRRGGLERGGVVHRGHRAHRGHVEVERGRANVHRLARRVLEGDVELGLAVAEHAFVVGDGDAESADGGALYLFRPAARARAARGGEGEEQNDGGDGR